jgi:hypothetical protein
MKNHAKQICLLLTAILPQSIDKLYRFYAIYRLPDWIGKNDCAIIPDGFDTPGFYGAMEQVRPVPLHHRTHLCTFEKGGSGKGHHMVSRKARRSP